MSQVRNRMYTRFIPHEEIEAVSAWQFGMLGDPALPVEPEPPPPDPGPPPEPEEVRLQRAWDAGHAAGYAEGHAAAARTGHEQLDQYVTGRGRESAERLAAVARALDERLVRSEQELARQVLDLAAELARQMVRRELALRPDAALPVVREAVSLLVADGRPMAVRLHPDDLQVVQAALREAHPDAPMQWLADAAVERGGCRVECGGAVVDGGLASRWQRVLANLGLDSPWNAPEGADAD